MNNTTNEKLRNVADVAARIMMGEKVVHPNQQKLDVHEPEKDELTADDFKKLRAGKKAPEVKKEEVESIDELSKDTLGSYIKKANYAGGMADFKHGRIADRRGDSKEKTALAATSHKRTKGISTAVDKLSKEEVEQMDEGKMGQLSADLKDLNHDDFHKEYGKPKSHYDPSNFKKPVQKGKEMDRAKALAQRGMASMKKEEVEELEEMFPGTPEYEKKYGKAPQDMKKGEKKKTTQGEMEKTEKGVVHKRKFSEMIESYSEGGVKGLFKTLAEEPTSAEFDAEIKKAQAKSEGKEKSDVAKAAVQAVQNEQTHTTVEFIDYNDVNGVKYAEIDLEERKMSEPEMEKKEEIVKGMKKGLSGFKERYGDRAKEVMYATATSLAKDKA